MQKEEAKDEINAITPTLLIGLGNAGREVITIIRQNIVAKYGNIRKFPMLGYCFVDIDQATNHLAEGHKDTIESETDFSENEVHIALTGNTFEQNSNLSQLTPNQPEIRAKLVDLVTSIASSEMCVQMIYSLAERTAGRISLHMASILRDIPKTKKIDMKIIAYMFQNYSIL